MFQISWKFGARLSRDQLGSPRAQILQVSNPVQGKEVEVLAMYPNSLASDLASAFEAASVDMPGVVSAGSFVAEFAGAPGVAFVDTFEVEHAGTLAVTGGNWGRDRYIRER